ncbi:MAG TPA: universal stress protein [Kofleriaceae bacterium]|nr:universal stress protein [Kofleriaceae bacterium]
MKILTALDGSEYAEIVLEHGLDQAVRNPDAELHFVTAIDSDLDDDAGREAARAWLDAAVREGQATFGLADRRVVLHVRRGRPAPAIAALAAELDADLLVIGRFHVPSESDVVIDIVECPTLVVGIEGHELEPQCRACRAARRESDGERLFCAEHADGRMADLTSRLPPSQSFASRIW